MKRALILTILYSFLCLFSITGFAQENDDTHPCPKKIILIGPPASGKGTQGALISKDYGIPNISTGDLLRNAAKAQTSEGESLRKTMTEGKLVSDSIVLNLLKTRLAEEDAEKGFILDGFPRTVSQAKALASNGIAVHTVIVLEVPDQTIIKRISGRWIHPGSGRTYHTENSPPKVVGKDDVTGETMAQRLKTYHKETKPVIEWYEKQAKNNHAMQALKVNATLPVEEIQSKIDAALDDEMACHIHG
jgi:adenylate kinase